MEQVVSEGKSLLETLTLPGDRKIIKKQMALALIQLGKNDEVKAIYQELLREDPNDPSLANSMGYFLVVLGIDLSEGERLIRKAWNWIEPPGARTRQKTHLLWTAWDGRIFAKGAKKRRQRPFVGRSICPVESIPGDLASPWRCGKCPWSRR